MRLRKPGATWRRRAHARQRGRAPQAAGHALTLELAIAVAAGGGGGGGAHALQQSAVPLAALHRSAAALRQGTAIGSGSAHALLQRGVPLAAGHRAAGRHWIAGAIGAAIDGRDAHGGDAVPPAGADGKAAVLRGVTRTGGG